MMCTNEQLRAAYALNLCTVSVAQIIDYNDIGILMQEYDNILNNLNIVFSEGIEQLELSLDIESMKEVKEKLLTELLRQDISIINFSEKQNNFEDIFIKMQRDMEV